jgi:HEAT repeat protein
MRTPANDDFRAWVERLADPIRLGRAYWHLALSGAPALEAVRGGLHHENADVRAYCTKALDRLVDRDSYGALLAMVDDAAPHVRLEALHALACDRCKEGCVQRTSDAFAAALRHLRDDADRHVRAMAVEVVGRFVHSDPRAAPALIESQQSDPDPSVRKKAGWYAPGGTIHRKTQPRSARLAHP